ncbi:ATP-binding cassette domain-containing protein [Microbacterium sp. ET2]|uniref:ATP-binding cassette domain-containing protein n=1 Tax=Microbacterium albipurpureum TaxID=3050384 RepID=UPI00259CD036|nr:ATP-binding cassette domain-containing protein [Microbacterium sp. ET2 (Ac-2212)]WJL96761.1 ATP-binding cassette domain-containing protein [Microbacterium sp. ET2 (Ac-2212)]
MTENLLTVENLEVTYGTGRRAFTAVRGIDLEVGVGETLGIVGESGSGKSTVGRALLGLARPTAGRIIFDGKDITHIGRRERREISRDLQVVFQDPRSSLNEAKRVGQILTEPLVANRLMSRKAAEARGEELLEKVGLGAAAMRRMPGSFSGGQRQRIAIARALMASPKLVVCDEPVSALDLSVQAQITNLFRKLQAETGVSYLFIAHDLSVVRLLSQRVAVMSKGGIVEQGPTEDVYLRPRELYTQRLLAAEPYPDPKIQRERRLAWEKLEPPVSAA